MNGFSQNVPANQTYEAPHTFPNSAMIPPIRWCDLSLMPQTENGSPGRLQNIFPKAPKNREEPLVCNTILLVRGNGD